MIAEKELEELGKLAAKQFLFSRTAEGLPDVWKGKWWEALDLKKTRKTRGWLSENPARLWKKVEKLLPPEFEGDVIFVGPWVWKEYVEKLRTFAEKRGKRLVLVDIVEEPLKHAGATEKQIRITTRFAGISHRLRRAFLPIQREFLASTPPLRGIVIAHEFTPLAGKELVALVKMLASGPIVLTFREHGKHTFTRTIEWIRRVAEAIGAKTVENEVRYPRRKTVYWVARIDPPEDPVGRALLETLAMLATTTRIRPLVSGRYVIRANEEAKRALKLAVRSVLRRLPEEMHDEFMERLRKVLCAGLEERFPDICGG